ncbi:hypothetical protein [Pedobacter psychrotolerans]|nr:hypothetical protein [Pedobacter psychrotolerans]
MNIKACQDEITIHCIYLVSLNSYAHTPNHFVLSLSYTKILEARDHLDKDFQSQPIFSDFQFTFSFYKTKQFAQLEKFINDG